MTKEHFFPFRKFKVPFKYFVKDVKLNNCLPAQFTTFEWENYDENEQTVSIYYFSYRLSFMVILIGLFIFAIIYSEPSPTFYMIYLTNWTFTLITLYGILSFVNSAIIFFKIGLKPLNITNIEVGNNDNADSTISVPQAPPGAVLESSTENKLNIQEELNAQQKQEIDRNKLNWLGIILWLIYSTTFVFSFIVTIGFWCFLYPAMLKDEESSKGDDQKNEDSLKDILFFRHIIVHGFNAFIICVETLIVSIPIHFMHQIYSFILGIIYLLFTLIYELACGEYPYKNEKYIYYFLNWKEHPLAIIPVPFIAAFAIFLIHLFAMLLYSTRLYMVSMNLKPATEVYRFHLYQYDQQVQNNLSRPQSQILSNSPSSNIP